LKKIPLRGASVAVQASATRVPRQRGAALFRKSKNCGAQRYSRRASPIPRGIDPIKALAATKSVPERVGMPGASRISNDDLLNQKCDILVPAALENVITLTNPSRQSRIVRGTANGPTTPHADEILARRGITVLPDILANAGGVTVSYFEWVQNQEACCGIPTK